MGQVSIENTIMNIGSSFKENSNTSNSSGLKKNQEKFTTSLEKAKSANNTQKDGKASKKEDRTIDSKATSSSDKLKAKTQLETGKKDTVRDTENTDLSAKVDELEDEVVSDKGNIENQLLMMMSEVLQIPIDEIQSQLEEMGMTVQDLLSEEGFGQFVGQILTQGDTNALLSGEIDVQKVSKLFEDLKALNEELLSIQDRLVVDKKVSPVLEETPIIEEVISETQVEITPSQAEQAEQAEIGIVTLDKSEVKPEEVSSRYRTEAKEEPELSFATNESSEANDLGINIPIHNFTTTTFTQSFASEPGLVAEATITKQLVNGKTLIEQVDFKVLSQTKEINIALSPKELGNMNIKIVEDHGTMVAEIKVDNQKAKDFILNEIGELKNSLEDQGLNVADVKVDIRQDNHEAQMQQERQKSSKRIQEILASFDEDEEEMTEPLISSESEVDYMV